MRNLWRSAPAAHNSTVRQATAVPLPPGTAQTLEDFGITARHLKHIDADPDPDRDKLMLAGWQIR